jgi:hypothetical protein
MIMAESHSAADIASRTVQLPSRPSNADCLTWSADRLASAGGEFVHIIDTTSKDLRFESLRINQFKTGDHRVEPAKGSEFSIGSEQSIAKAVAISFSCPGLGIHSRAVLAVLTANHLLSFWEHTGKSNTWHRTCVVNTSEALPAGLSNDGRPFQVHASTWLPSVRFGAGQQAIDAQFLALIDGDHNLWILRVFKTNKTSKGKWRFENIHKVPIVLDPAVVKDSPLTSSLAHNAYSFDIVQCQRWQKFFNESGHLTMGRIRLLFKKEAYRPDPRGYLSAALTVEFDTDQLFLSCHMAGFTFEEMKTVSPQDFIDVIVEPAQSYDKEWNLQGHYSIHWMGFATSVDLAHVAACVVFKPSASPQYTQPRDEKSTVLIAAAGQESIAAPTVANIHNVQLDILQCLARLANIDTITTDTDVKIIHLAIKMINLVFPSDQGLIEWSETAGQLLALIESDDGASENTAHAEVCEICRFNNKTVTLDITADGQRGKCPSGHDFYRCGITFLAIQDPGICKYCVRCGRQFLCIEQVEAEDGPSLGRTLLDECGAGLCPYCQGYFADA